ncbi:MAG: tetratricopeptide repeat protein [Methylovulum sp.]|nr:tetratricopeptide repeat protein [Methylovulum sp.]
MPKKFGFIVLAVVLGFGANVWAEEAATAEAAVQQAAGRGDAKAQAKLGAMYLLGNGLDKNEPLAVEWLLKAAKQGNVDAQVLVAALFDRGIGVTSDIKQGTYWYEQAAAQGHTTAQAILGKNPVAAGGVAFSYQKMRLSAAKQIPTEYAKKILLSK